MSNYPNDCPPKRKDAPWNDDDSRWTKWEYYEKWQCRRCLKDTGVDEEYLCEACFEPEELTEADYLDE